MSPEKFTCHTIDNDTNVNWLGRENKNYVKWFSATQTLWRGIVVNQLRYLLCSLSRYLIVASNEFRGMDVIIC